MASRLMRLLASGLIFNATFPLDAVAAPSPVSVAQPVPAQPFNEEQLDALLASIALYPDELLTQLLMASTFPLEIVAAARWVEDQAHKSLTGDALVKALEAEPWDPSVKSLVPFPVVLATLNNNLPWLQQLGYAFATQQADVFASIQRLRQRAQASGHLQSSPQHRQHADRDSRAWRRRRPSGQRPGRDPAGGDRHRAGPSRYRVCAELQSRNSLWRLALCFVSALLRSTYRLLFRDRIGHRACFRCRCRGDRRPVGLGQTRRGGGYGTINVNRRNKINVNGGQISSNRFQANFAGNRANFARAPNGPVGLPGRSQVSVPGSAVRPPTRVGGVRGVGGVARPGGLAVLGVSVG